MVHWCEHHVLTWVNCDDLWMCAGGEGQAEFHQGACWRPASNTLRAGDSRPRGLVPGVSPAQRQEEGSNTEMARKERGNIVSSSSKHHYRYH